LRRKLYQPSLYTIRSRLVGLACDQAYHRLLSTLPFKGYTFNKSSDQGKQENSQIKPLILGKMDSPAFPFPLLCYSRCFLPFLHQQVSLLVSYFQSTLSFVMLWGNVYSNTRLLSSRNVSSRNACDRKAFNMMQPEPRWQKSRRPWDQLLSNKEINKNLWPKNAQWHGLKRHSQRSPTMYPPITEQGSKPDERHTVHRENPDYKKSLFLTMIYMVLLYRENSRRLVYLRIGTGVLIGGKRAQGCGRT
jgi:hypothetical protein